MMDKVNEILAAVFTAFASLVGWFVRKMFQRIEKLETKVNKIECSLLTKEDLEGIKETQSLILKHLLEGKNK